MTKTVSICVAKQRIMVQFARQARNRLNLTITMRNAEVAKGLAHQLLGFCIIDRFNV